MISRTASLLMLFLAATALAQEKTDQEERTVAVSARSEVVVPPDQVLIDFTVATKEEALTDARNANDKITRSVFQIVHQLEIPAEDFQVTDLTVSLDRDRWGVPDGYKVNRSFSVRIQKFAVIEPFVGALIDADVTRIDQLRFQVRDQRPHLREARRQAFEYAREKAQELAELSQMELGDVISVDEDVQYNYDADGGGGMGGMGGFGGVVRATPQRGDAETVPVRSEPASAPRLAHAGLYRVSFPLAPQDQAAASADALELLAPGVARLNAEIHVKFELRKPERAIAHPTRRP
ncbi:MAG: SIMPL domain-containing protein [Pirellulaceae bacterium]